MIDERFEQSIEAFKYWSFPFYCKFVQDSILNQTFNNVDSKLVAYSTHVSKFLNDVRRSGFMINPSVDNLVNYRLFDRDMPFFKWSSKQYPYEIKQLLSGEMTTLYADIEFSHFNVIKFCTLNVLIEENDASVNKTLNELLNEFYIELIHSGDSDYKYLEKTYEISMNYQSYEKLYVKYQYGSKININANGSYKKLEGNKQGVLSPYTLWQFKLKATKPQDENQLLERINSLLHSGIEIRLVLYGYGQYVEFSETNSCENN